MSSVSGALPARTGAGGVADATIKAVFFESSCLSWFNCQCMNALMQNALIRLCLKSTALPLADLPQKHRDAQPFARGLARQELALALRQMSALAVMLRVGVSEKAGTQEHAMLP